MDIVKFKGVSFSHPQYKPANTNGMEETNSMKTDNPSQSVSQYSNGIGKNKTNIIHITEIATTNAQG